MNTDLTKQPGPACEPDQKNLEGKQRGFTLMEILISVGFMAALAGLISGSSFLAIRTQAETGAVVDVAVETAKTTRWLVRDVHRAATTDLTDPDTAATTATFNWDNGVPVTCTFALNGTDLVRTCGGTPFTVGRHISNLEFDRVGNLITVSYQIVPPTAPTRAEAVEVNIALGGG